MEEFINLHNRTVSRSEVERVISIAKEQNNTEVIYRLSRILNAYPTEQRFVINIKDYPTPPTALAGAHHTGDYREALDDCGRLKKGWKFSKGQVVKVVPKAKKTPNTPTATTAVVSKQLVSYTPEKFASDLDINKLERSLHWLSFEPKGRAQREQESFGNSIAELYTSNLEQAKQTGALEAYNDAFDKGYSYILKNYLEMVGIRARTFSTAITGGAGITERKIASNEKLMRSEHERLQKHIDLQEKLQEILAKIAKNKPTDQYEEGDVIKSTDNNAITKLQQKLKMLQDRKTMLKNGVVAAKEYQKSKDISVFKQYNIDSETTEQIINHIDKGGKPTEKDMYSWFTMPYLNRDIKEVENRIATLEKNQAKGTDETLIEGGKIVYNGEAQRLQIFFDGIPSKEVREALKSHAFKWAPTAKAWQRTLTENAKYAVKQYLIKTGILKLRTALSVPSQDDELTFLAAAGVDYFEEAPDDKAQGLGKPIPAADIYKMITDKVISMFKNAKASDYHRAWKDDAFFIPLNFDSKKPYRGVNRLLLQERIGFAGAFRNPYFLTFNQIKKHGGRLKKGTRGYEVVYYSIRYIVPADKNTGRKAYSSTNTQKVIDYLAKNKLSEDIVTRIPMIRYYNVYNGASIEGIDFQLDKLQIGRAVPDTASKNQAAALIVENYPNPPAIKHEGNQAYYSPSGDYVKMPKKEQFDSINDYYRTLFHELTHSTGHEKRLDRGINLMLEKEDYAKEELVAEFGAVFLSAWAGIMWYNNKNHAAYLKSWNSAIKEAENDNKFLMKAASLAQAATDYILNLDAAGQPAFLSKYEKPNKAEKPKKKAEKPKKKAEKPKKKAEKAKPEAKKATEKADNTDKKYKFIAFYNVFGRIVGLYSYQELTINEFYLKNTFDNGIKVYAPLRSLEKIEETKRKIEKQYTEGKDFICLTFESEKSEEYYSLLIHSNEKTKPEAPEKAITVNESNDLLYFNVDRSNPQPQPISLVKAKYNSDFEKEYSRISDKKGYFKPTFNNKRNLQILRSLCSDFIGTINTHDYIESAPKSKTTGIMSLKKIVSKDKLRPTLTGVYIDKDYYIATDAFKLIWLPRHKNDEYKTGWILDLNFKCQKLDGCKPEESVIDGRFPIDSIIKMKNAPIAYTSQQLDITTLLDHLYRGEKAIKSLAPYQIPMVIALSINKEDIYMDIKNLLDALDVLRANGAKSLTMNFENLSGKSPIHILTNNHLQALIMPRYFATEKDIPTVNTCLMIAPLPLTLTEISKPTKGLSAPTDGTLFGKYPEISTDTFKDMKVSELRAFTLSYYLTHLKGKKVAIKNHLKEVIFTTKAGRKIAKGEAMYKEKAAVVECLEELIKNSTYNNWGSRKTQDNPNILGYLNFKSKLTIDGEKRHVRIAISLTRERKTELKNVEVGKKKSASFRKATVVNPQDGRNETLSTNIPAKTMPNKSANKQIDKLAVSIKEKSTTPPRRGRAKSFCGDSAPTNTPAKTMPNTLANRQIDKLAVPTVYVEHLPEETNRQISTSANTLDAKMAALQTRNWETFVIANPQLQRFLGDVERKTSESTVITIAGGAGSGKTRFAFQFINALAQNYTVGHASLEEHPDSKLYYDKVQQYIDETALPNIEAPEIKDLDQLEALIQRNEVIVIDSFAKLQELNPRFLLDRDLRKKYDGKLFLLIYQLTGEGKMRGGSKSEYDGDIILLTHVAPDYRENYIYPSKNRYNALPATQLRYSTYFQQMLDIPKELGTGSRPPEAISLPPAPQTNVYEVIY